MVIGATRSYPTDSVLRLPTVSAVVSSAISCPGCFAVSLCPPAGPPPGPHAPAAAVMVVMVMTATVGTRVFTAVVLLVVVVAELLAVVAATDEVSPTAAMSVMSAAVARPVTVSLPHAAGVLRCAAPSSVEVTPGAALSVRGVQGNMVVLRLGLVRYYRAGRLWPPAGARAFAAVVLLVVIVTELLAVVTSAN